MIAKLEGTIDTLGLNWLILNVGGVGYKVFVPNRVLETTKGEKLNLFTHLHIRENSQELYGFVDFADLELFEILISVSGVGPKGAMSILANSSNSEIRQAILQENPSVFTAVSGIGKKVAAKIILELKSKLTGEDLIGTLPKNLDDASAALGGLGYTGAEINQILRAMPENMHDPEKQVAWALKRLGRRKI